MKCPHCGHWNRASLPRCFKCGMPLTPPAKPQAVQDDPASFAPAPSQAASFVEPVIPAPQPNPPAQTLPEPQPSVPQPQPIPAKPAKEKGKKAAPAGKTYIRYNESGHATTSEDDRDALARDMQSLQERKQRGYIVQQQLRQNSAQQGIAPTGRHVQSMSGQTAYPSFYQNVVIRNDEKVEGDVRQDAIAVVSSRTNAQPEQDVLDFSHTTPYAAPTLLRSRKNARNFGMRRYLWLIALLLCAIAIGFALYYFIPPLVWGNRTPPLQEQAEISYTIYNDVAAHRIKIPSDQEGAMIWIKELHRSCVVTGGYAIVEVEDYKWYEDLELSVQDAQTDKEREKAQAELDALLEKGSVTATLTPSITTEGNVQKPMGTISFEVEIPPSPLSIKTPDSLRDEASTISYAIIAEVAPNSTVYINKEEHSTRVKPDGTLEYQAKLKPIGDNVFTFTARAPHCRPTTVDVVIYREYQVIPLDMQADINLRYSPRLIDDTSKPKDAKGKYPQKEEPMVVRCSTTTNAHIEILSEYRNLDLSMLPIDGTFSFEPVFRKIGTNTITIIASDPTDPSIPPSVLEHDIYYVPIASVYTPKAWDMCDEYNDFLNNSATRIARSQIYVCKGTIVEILSENPQLAIMSLDANPSRTVLLENKSNDEYVLGQRYRVYGDAYGMYNGMPRLVGRYTYPPLN